MFRENFGKNVDIQRKSVTKPSREMNFQKMDL